MFEIDVTMRSVVSRCWLASTFVFFHSRPQIFCFSRLCFSIIEVHDRHPDNHCESLSTLGRLPNRRSDQLKGRSKTIVQK